MGILVQALSGYGRAILRGVTRYANLQRRWLLYKDLGPDFEVAGYPRFDGVICTGVDAAVVERAGQHCKHIIWCSGRADPLEYPVVSIDDEAAGRQAAEHLMECRLERFAFYGSLVGWGPVAEKRLRGFTRALEAKGFSNIECPVLTPTHREWATHAQRPSLIKWLRGLERPVGILAIDDSVAHELAEACLEADIAVPEHVAIVGINNDDLMCESAWPPLSSVEGGFIRVGYAAAKLLERILEGEQLSPEERHVLLPPLGVVQRQSTNILAVDDPNLADALRFIRENACNPCTVHDVLNVVPVGRRWLERQFAAQVGRTPHEEISRVRIDTARRLLRDSDLSVNEIAFRCGFSDLKSFYHTFGTVAGIPPAAYRRQAHKTTTA